MGGVSRSRDQKRRAFRSVESSVLVALRTSNLRSRAPSSLFLLDRRLLRRIYTLSDLGNSSNLIG